MTGYNLPSGYGSLSGNTFTFDESTRTVVVISTTADNKLILNIAPKLPDISNATLHIGSEEFAFADATPSDNRNLLWANVPSWSTSDSLTAKITRQLHYIAPQLAYAVHPASAARAANTVSFAHQLMRRHAEVRRSGSLDWLRPDAKSQVFVATEKCG